MNKCEKLCSNFSASFNAGRGIKIDRVNKFDQRNQIDDFLQYLTCHCTVSVIMSHRFLCLELASTSLSLYTLAVMARIGKPRTNRCQIVK